MTFEQLYHLLAERALKGDLAQVAKSIATGDKHNLDCLLNPNKHPIVLSDTDKRCSCDKHACVVSCLFDAIECVGGEIIISHDKCVGCNMCVEACVEKKLFGGKELIGVIERIKSKEAPVYALLAPAIVGQFGDDITVGHIRSALKNIGFTGVVEVATFADILTLKEAIEFAHRQPSDSEYQLTSCCCPVWIALIKKNFNKLSSHLVPAVSPMVAAGRCVKIINPSAVTVFISPCLAKKAEAKEADIKDAIDYVISFGELKDLFELVDMNLSECEPEEKEHSSFGGRIYAKTGGVSRAVSSTYDRIMEGKGGKLIARQADGVLGCKQLLNEILEGKIDANFYEGMGCAGGCVGGIKAIRDKAETAQSVENYAGSAKYSTPIDNPYVIELLGKLGYNTIGELLADEELLSRKM